MEKNVSLSDVINSHAEALSRLSVIMQTPGFYIQPEQQTLPK